MKNKVIISISVLVIIVAVVIAVTSANKKDISYDDINTQKENVTYTEELGEVADAEHNDDSTEETSKQKEVNIEDLTEVDTGIKYISARIMTDGVREYVVDSNNNIYDDYTVDENGITANNGSVVFTVYKEVNPGYTDIDSYSMLCRFYTEVSNYDDVASILNNIFIGYDICEIASVNDDGTLNVTCDSFFSFTVDLTNGTYTEK